MSRWLFALVVAVVLTGFALLLVAGDHLNDGPVLLRVTADHGIHLGDVFVITGWAAALLCEFGLLRTVERQ